MKSRLLGRQTFDLQTGIYFSIFIVLLSFSVYLWRYQWTDAQMVLMLVPVLVASIYYFITGGIIAAAVSIILTSLLGVLYGPKVDNITVQAISIVFPALSYIIFGVAIGKTAMSFKDAIAELEQHQLINTFSGIYTREYLANLIQRRINEYERYDSPFSIILMEVADNAIENIWKNKREQVLMKIALSIRGKIRMIDEVARYQSQFLLVLPHTSSSGSKIVEERTKTISANILKENGCNIPEPDAIYSITVSYPENKENMDKLLNTMLSAN